MKTAFLWLSLCLAVTAARSAAPRTDDPVGITFFKGSWNDVLSEAKRQNKPVFVDIYTTWCGPCKTMAKQAFPDAKVGEKFNASFISYQIDAEKGEGIEVAKKYAVNAYPTSLYVSANGDLIHRAIGYGGIKGMLDEADKAIEAFKDPNPLSVMEKQYEGGKRDADFLQSYLAKRAAIGMPNGDALDAYLKVVPEAEWNADKNLAVIGGNMTTARSKAFDYLLEKVPALRTNQKVVKPVFSGLDRAIFNDFDKAVANKSEVELEENVAFRRQLINQTQPTPLSTEATKTDDDKYRMRFYQQTKNTDKYRPLAVAQANQLMAVSMDSLKAKNEASYKRFQLQTANMPDSVKNTDNFKKYAEQMKTVETGQMAMKLNNLAWTYYQTMTDPKDLNQALAWSGKSLEYDRSGGYLDTYAHLLSKLGRKDEAIKTQEEAIAKEKAAGNDAAELEKGLAEIKQK